MDLTLIGPRIGAARRAKGLTQAVLAEKVSVTPKYISNVECGAKIPRLETFLEIANALGVDANSLLVDVLDTAPSIMAASITESMSALPLDEQNRILRLVDLMVKDAAR